MKQALPWIAVSVVLGSVGQLLLKVVAQRLGPGAFGHEPLLVTILRLAQVPLVWLGLVFFGISMLLWIRALSTAPVGVAYPMVSSGYVIVAVLAWILLREPMRLSQVGGIVFVLIGVAMLAGVR